MQRNASRRRCQPYAAAKRKRDLETRRVIGEDRYAVESRAVELGCGLRHHGHGRKQGVRSRSEVRAIEAVLFELAGFAAGTIGGGLCPQDRSCLRQQLGVA